MLYSNVDTTVLFHQSGNNPIPYTYIITGGKTPR